MNAQEVTVKVCSFNDLFTKKPFILLLLIRIQPYVWGKDKIQELINDLNSIWTTTKVTLLHGQCVVASTQRKTKTFIIDGQQRLTTLSILYYVLFVNFRWR